MVKNEVTNFLSVKLQNLFLWEKVTQPSYHENCAGKIKFVLICLLKLNDEEVLSTISLSAICESEVSWHHYSHLKQPTGCTKSVLLSNMHNKLLKDVLKKSLDQQISDRIVIKSSWK